MVLSWMVLMMISLDVPPHLKPSGSLAGLEDLTQPHSISEGLLLDIGWPSFHKVSSFESLVQPLRRKLPSRAKKEGGESPEA